MMSAALDDPERLVLKRKGGKLPFLLLDILDRNALRILVIDLPHR